MLRRLRRLRVSKVIRNLVREIKVNVEDLIYLLFVVEGENIKEEIKFLLDVYYLLIDMLEDEIKEISELGIEYIMLFGVLDEKDECVL